MTRAQGAARKGPKHRQHFAQSTPISQHNARAQNHQPGLLGRDGLGFRFPSLANLGQKALAGRAGLGEGGRFAGAIEPDRGGIHQNGGFGIGRRDRLHNSPSSQLATV